MATVQVNITVPDPNVAAMIAALQVKYPPLVAESTANYFKRIVGIILKKEIKQVLAQQAAQAAALAAQASQGDPPLTTS